MKSKNILGSILSMLTIALVLCSFAVAQEETTATVTGQVTDSAGAAVPNVRIVARHVDTGIERTVQSSEEGTFTIFPLNPGEYTLTVEQAGFKKYVQNITLNAKD